MSVGLSATIVFSMRMFHQSSDMFRPSAKVGLHTKPRVFDSEVSGVRFGLEPDRNGIGDCVSGPGATPPACAGWR